MTVTPPSHTGTRFHHGQGMAYPLDMSNTPTAAHWLILADDARTAAAQMRDVGAQRTLMGIAAAYDKLARHAALAEATKRQAQHLDQPPAGPHTRCPPSVGA
jgi:hypothetical protein